MNICSSTPARSMRAAPACWCPGLGLGQVDPRGGPGARRARVSDGRARRPRPCQRATTALCQAHHGQTGELRRAPDLQPGCRRCTAAGALVGRGVAGARRPRHAGARSGEPARRASWWCRATSRGAETALTPLSETEAFLSLALNAVNLLPHGAAGTAALGRLAAGAACFALTMSDLDEACRLVLGLVADDGAAAPGEAPVQAERPRAARPLRRGGASAVELDDNVALYDEVGQLLILLNTSAAAVWELCDGATTVDEMVRALAEAHGHEPTPAVIREDVRQTVGKLAELGLVDRPAGEADEPARAEVAAPRRRCGGWGVPIAHLPATPAPTRWRRPSGRRCGHRRRRGAGGAARPDRVRVAALPRRDADRARRLQRQPTRRTGSLIARSPRAASWSCTRWPSGRRDLPRARHQHPAAPDPGHRHRPGGDGPARSTGTSGRSTSSPSRRATRSSATRSGR